MAHSENYEYSMVGYPDSYHIMELDSLCVSSDVCDCNPKITIEGDSFLVIHRAGN